jgi:hypothetical protein
MDFRRTVTCCSITGLLALSLPHVAWAEEGSHDSGSTSECETEDVATVTSGRDDSTSGRDDSHEGLDIRTSGRDDSHEGLDSGATDGEDDCVLAPPPDVPEAPRALLLSASAAVTGGAAVLIIRRRARNSVGSLRT